MSDEDLTAIIKTYQQKTFELYNKNIVLETQVEKLSASLSSLNAELEKLKKSKRVSKAEKDFE
jgi:hypothetical protein